MIYAWLVSLALFAIITITVFLDWIFRSNKLNGIGTIARIIISVVGLISFFVFTITTLIMTNPDYNAKNATVTITPITKVYQSNLSFSKEVFYYISTNENSTLCEIHVGKVSNGDSNYIITKTYENGAYSNELVLIDKENIPLLPNFNQ